MTPKRPRLTGSKPQEPTSNRRGTLTHSDIPGVFLNELNIPCDEFGVALSFKQVKERDVANLSEVLGGEVVDTPAKYLKSLALDPRLSMATRMEAAKAAAPYSDRKQPTALDGGMDPLTGAVIPLMDYSKLKTFSDLELKTLSALLIKAGLQE